MRGLHSSFGSRTESEHTGWSECLSPPWWGCSGGPGKLQHTNTIKIICITLISTCSGPSSTFLNATLLQTCNAANIHPSGQLSRTGATFCWWGTGAAGPGVIVFLENVTRFYTRTVLRLWEYNAECVHLFSPLPSPEPPPPPTVWPHNRKEDIPLRELVLTVFGEEVDDRVRLTVAVEVSQLGAAVDRHVVDAEPPLAAAAGVQHGALQGKQTGRAFLTNELAATVSIYSFTKCIIY